MPDFGLEAPSSPREMQEYNEDLYHRRRELNLKSRSRSSSPTNRSRYDSDSVYESSSVMSSASYRRNITARHNNYGKPQFVSPARRAHSADTAYRRVKGAARNMTSPMLQPESRGRSTQAKRKSRQGPAETLGGVPSYMTPTFSSMHHKATSAKKVQVAVSHAIEHSAKHSSTYKAEQLNETGKHFTHYVNEADLVRAEKLKKLSDAASHLSGNNHNFLRNSRKTKSCTKLHARHILGTGDAPSQGHDLKDRVRAQHDLEHSKEKSITYSREHLQGKDFYHANNKHLPGMSSKREVSMEDIKGDIAPSAHDSIATEGDQTKLPPEPKDDLAMGESNPQQDDSETSSKKNSIPDAAPTTVEESAASTAKSKVMDRMAKLKAKASVGAEETINVERESSKGDGDKDEAIPTWGTS